MDEEQKKEEGAACTGEGHKCEGEKKEGAACEGEKKDMPAEAPAADEAAM